MRNVLLAVDGSEASTKAARFFARLPHFKHLKITILTVVNRSYVHGSYSVNELIQETFEEDLRKAKEHQEEIAKLFEGADADIESSIVGGNVSNAIISKANEIEADLIVMGALGHSAISRTLLGSVSDAVATGAPCSVLIVRPRGSMETDRKLKLCLAYEGRSPAKAALEELKDSPWKTNIEIDVVSVYPTAYSILNDSESLDDLQSNLAEAKDELGSVFDHVQTHLIREPHVGESLVQFIEGNGTDLAVIGETPRTTIGRMFMGSKSRFVLRHAPCSVWIARNRAVEPKPDEPAIPVEIGKASS